MDTGHIGVQSFAEINGRVKQVFVRSGYPEIQVVTLRPAEETAVVVIREICRKATLPRRLAMMNRTIPIHLVAPSGGRHEAQQLEDLLHRHLGADSLKIDARHRIGPES